MLRHPTPLLAALVLGLFFPAGAGAEYQLEDAFPSLTFVLPTDIQAPPDGSQRLFVVEKSGAIWVFPADHLVSGTEKRLFLEISAKVRNSGEAGLLGLAFHPNYKNNGCFYIYYVSEYPYRNILARYHVSADPNEADAASEVIVLDVPKTSFFHNGGQIRFGNDGYLYIAMGDDLSASYAQNLTDPRGSILRIDVGEPQPGVAASPAYTIPADNPFAGNDQGYREEIFAYGFRNPWRFSIDRVTGELWVADVGEASYEELDLVAAGRNYGWPLMEGPVCFDPAECDTSGMNLTAPLYWYSHAEGVAIIGGQRYWGRHAPELAGQFIFADYTGAAVWALNFDGAGVPERSTLVQNAPALLTFGEGPVSTRELYIGAGDGKIYRLGRVVSGAGDTPPPTTTRLVGNFPNPFNPATTVRCELAAAGRVTLEIVSVAGERVRRIDAGVLDAGTHDVAWRGDTDAGGRAASGVYFCRLIVEGVARDAMRMVLVQ